MKFTFSWLKDHLDTKLDVYKIADTLTNIGLEVESIQDRSIEFKSFSVGHVIKVGKHPNADRLKVCLVKTIKGKYQVVCGAPNVRIGMKGIFAPVNSFIPSTGIKLNKVKIRGVESSGMLVSEKEMGISDDHERIIEVKESQKIGESFAKIYGLDDPIIEINITPNRGDCLSIRGIARDLYASGIGKLKTINLKLNPGSFPSPIKWTHALDKRKTFLCPLVAGRYFKNVKNKSSPDWLQKRLISIGLRPISSLVDITNYITYDLGRPLHVFDADKINGNLSMRMAKDSEECVTLDGKKQKLNNNMIVIADSSKVHAIGGIMGGEESACTENTTNVFLEVALFDSINISKTGKNLDVQSDARYRFERGIDPNSVEIGLNVATKMILDLCGGEVSKITNSRNYSFKSKNIKYHYDKVTHLAGIKVNKERQKKILTKLGFKILNKKNNSCNIIIPGWRLDIDGEADIVEEIVRIFGYDNIKPIPVLKQITDQIKPLNSQQSVRYQSKRLIASRGYHEVVTWSFMSSKYANYFNLYDNFVKLDNPISSDLDIMRPSILPNLLESVNKNHARLFDSFGIFEIGPQFENLNPDGQHMMATGIKYGSIYPSNWNDEKRIIDVFDIKADIYSLLSFLKIPLDNLIMDSNVPDWYHPGKSSKIRLGKNIIGYFGEINPKILNIYEINNNVCSFEIFLDKLGQFNSKNLITQTAFNNNPYQAIERDFAFIVDKGIPSSEITNAIKKMNQDLIKDVSIFDVFEGGSIPSGKKSIAIKIILQPKSATFTDKQIEEISNQLVKKIITVSGGTIRK